MPQLRPLLILGTRPEAIKLAPLVHACARQADEIAASVCLTGQHREMLRQVVAYFELPVRVDLDLMAAGQTLGELTARCVQGLDAVLRDQRPDCVVVQGDTTTAMCGALAAFYQRIPLVHVEAGLRTGDLGTPWPEELNRRIVSMTAVLHCAPTERAASNLRAEGVRAADIHVTGNTVIDALLWTVERERARASHWRAQYGALDGRDVVLVTVHRRESFGEALESILSAVAELSCRFADVAFVFPVHPNPHVHEAAHRLLGRCGNIHLLEPLSYPEFVWLMDRSRLILSDSGGVQEEAPSLRKPVLVLRQTTERPEASEAGAAKIVGISRERIVKEAARLLTDDAHYRAHQIERNPYGDGRAADRIVDLMLSRGWHASPTSPTGRAERSRQPRCRSASRLD